MFKDLNVVKVINMVIDCEVLVKGVFYGNAKVVMLLIDLGVYFYIDAYGYFYDFVKVKELMVQLKFVKGFKVMFNLLAGDGFVKLIVMIM